nr:immunoglobulin light chain junction region [Macaca mulatta]
SQQYDNFPF